MPRKLTIPSQKEKVDKRPNVDKGSEKKKKKKKITSMG